MDSNRLSLIDTHAHLCAPEFDDDLGAVLSRARAAGVAAVIAVGETLADAARNLELSRRHPLIRPAAGLYPTVLEPGQAETLQDLIRRNRSELVAIGEVGLDHWVVKEEKDRELQSAIFYGFIALARELDLPLNVHSRSAGRQAIELLLRAGAARVQMHAFDGRASSALPAVEAGYFFSIPPSVVRSRQKQKLVKQLPLGCLLVETDSPVLGPEPGARNEPATLALAVRAIAEIKSLPEQSVAEAVTANTVRLYGRLGGNRS
ncbi:MAG: TatD family hydrolase [Desulfobacterales bacterium]|jgi:TatD DNase family protein|nr:TatD family hydrolase [Desulfobacterales bacterium]